MGASLRPCLPSYDSGNAFTGAQSLLHDLGGPAALPVVLRFWPRQMRAVRGMSAAPADAGAGQCNGVGYVNYCESGAARRAAEALNGVRAGERLLHVMVQQVCCAALRCAVLGPTLPAALSWVLGASKPPRSAAWQACCAARPSRAPPASAPSDSRLLPPANAQPRHRSRQQEERLQLARERARQEQRDWQHQRRRRALGEAHAAAAAAAALPAALPPAPLPQQALLQQGLSQHQLTWVEAAAVQALALQQAQQAQQGWPAGHPSF